MSRSDGARPTMSVALGVIGLLLGVCTAEAAETRLWTEGPAHLKRGDADGIAVTSGGTLFLAPKTTPLGGGETSRRQAHVWSVASDPSGTVYLGTGPEGRVVKLTPAGEESVLFTVEEPMVTALVVLPGGDVLAGTTPAGKVYRISPDGTGRVWAETGERYVWSLMPGPEGTVFAGTGEQGVVFRIEPSGNAMPLFDSDEPHIVSLATRPDGSLVAGGAGRGLIYEIDPEGHAFVLHDDELPEVRALAIDDGGDLWAALLGPPQAEPRPPAVKIQLPDGAQLGPTSESVGDLEEPRGPTVEGVIEGLRLPSEPEAPGQRGRVIRISPDGEINQIWGSRDEAAYSLVLDAAGRAVFGTGEPGRLYRTDGDDEVALLASVAEGQVSGLLSDGRALVFATSNPASAYRVEGSPTDRGEFLSRPFDAGSPARWGSIRWSQEGDTGRAELYTRTGNSADPDGTWSAWGPALTDLAGSPIVNPDARFLQWRLRLSGADGARTRLSHVTVSYAPYNRAPAIEDFRLHPPATAISETAIFRWSVSDADGDAVEVRLEYAPSGSDDWEVAHTETSDPVTPGGDGGVWRAGEGSWETSEVPEGSYVTRAVCSDRIANHPGDGRETRSTPLMSLIVDRSPPQIRASEAGGMIRVEVTDEHSPIRRLEVVHDGTVAFRVRPDDGVCDSMREGFEIARRDLDLSGAVVLRAFDSAGNPVEWPLP